MNKKTFITLLVCVFLVTLSACSKNRFTLSKLNYKWNLKASSYNPSLSHLNEFINNPFFDINKIPNFKAIKVHYKVESDNYPKEARAETVIYSPMNNGLIYAASHGAFKNTFINEDVSDEDDKDAHDSDDEYWLAAGYFHGYDNTQFYYQPKLPPVKNEVFAYGLIQRPSTTKLDNVTSKVSARELSVCRWGETFSGASISASISGQVTDVSCVDFRKNVIDHYNHETIRQYIDIKNNQHHLYYLHDYSVFIQQPKDEVEIASSITHYTNHSQGDQHKTVRKYSDYFVEVDK